MTVRQLRKTATKDSWYEVTTSIGIYNVYFHQVSPPQNDVLYLKVDYTIPEKERDRRWEEVIDNGVKTKMGLATSGDFYNATVDVLETFE